MSLEKFKWLSSLEWLFWKILLPKMIYSCEAPRSMLSNYPKTNVELKYGACNLKNKVSAHRLGLVVHLSWRVAPPSKRYSCWLDEGIIKHLRLLCKVKRNVFLMKKNLFISIRSIFIRYRLNPAWLVFTRTM